MRFRRRYWRYIRGEDVHEVNWYIVVSRSGARKFETGPSISVCLRLLCVREGYIMGGGL